MDVYDYGYLHFDNTIIRPEVKQLQKYNDLEKQIFPHAQIDFQSKISFLRSLLVSKKVEFINMNRKRRYTFSFNLSVHVKLKNVKQYSYQV